MCALAMEGEHCPDELFEQAGRDSKTKKKRTHTQNTRAPENNGGR